MAKKVETKENETNNELAGKKLKGVVVSDKMQDTAVVEVQRYYKHSKYGKFIKEKKRYKAHNKDNEFKNSDKVVIQETKPISKDKRFIIVEKQ